MTLFILDDEKSISNLAEVTASCFDSEKVRLLYIAARIKRIDLKVDAAIEDVIQRYKSLVKSTVVTGFIPGGSSLNRPYVSVKICSAVVDCFGILNLSQNTVFNIIKPIIWEELSKCIPHVAGEVLFRRVSFYHRSCIFETSYSGVQ